MGVTNQYSDQGRRSGPESSRQTLVSPIFRSSLIPSSVADCFRKCFSGTNLQTLKIRPPAPPNSRVCAVLIHSWVQFLLYIFGLHPVTVTNEGLQRFPTKHGTNLVVTVTGWGVVTKWYKSATLWWIYVPNLWLFGTLQKSQTTWATPKNPIKSHNTDWLKGILSFIACVWPRTSDTRLRSILRRCVWQILHNQISSSTLATLRKPPGT